MALLVLLTAAAGPAFNAMTASRGVTSGAADVADFMEMARTEAVTRQTYVWVGITGVSISGVQMLKMAAAYSADGSGTPPNLTGTNIKPFTKVLQVQNVVFSGWASLSGSTQALWSSGVPSSNPAPADIAGTIGTSGTVNVVFTAGGVTFNSATMPFLTYSPEGQAILSGTASPSVGYGPQSSMAASSGTSTAFYDIALREARGSAIPPPGAAHVAEAVVIIDAATGAPSILQLH